MTGTVTGMITGTMPGTMPGTTTGTMTRMVTGMKDGRKGDRSDGRNDESGFYWRNDVQQAQAPTPPPFPWKRGSCVASDTGPAGVIDDDGW